MTMLLVLLTVAVALLGVLVVGLLRSHAVILRRLHELGAGLEPEDGSGALPLARPATDDGPVTRDQQPSSRTAADLVGNDLDGATRGIRVNGTEHDTLLAFLTSGCETCRSFFDELADPDLRLPVSTRLIIVAKDPSEESVSALAELAPSHLPIVLSGDAWRDYDVPGSPYVIHVEGRTGRIVGEGTGGTWAQVIDFLALASSDAQGRHRRRKHRADAERERTADRELLAAGITPGDKRLTPGRAKDAANEG